VAELVAALEARCDSAQGGYLVAPPADDHCAPVAEELADSAQAGSAAPPGDGSAPAGCSVLPPADGLAAGCSAAPRADGSADSPHLDVRSVPAGFPDDSLGQRGQVRQGQAVPDVRHSAGWDVPSSGLPACPGARPSPWGALPPRQDANSRARAWAEAVQDSQPSPAAAWRTAPAEAAEFSWR